MLTIFQAYVNVNMMHLSLLSVILSYQKQQNEFEQL